MLALAGSLANRYQRLSDRATGSQANRLTEVGSLSMINRRADEPADVLENSSNEPAGLGGSPTARITVLANNERRRLPDLVTPDPSQEAR